MNGDDGSLFDELLWVHGMIRRDLASVRELATATSNGASADEVRRELAALKTNGPLWRLKVNCLRYCSFVHAHHGAEDRMLFPALRAADPGLGSVIERLEADHRRVSDLLDEVEARAHSLSESEAAESRARLAGALDRLATDLLEHLEFEEESVEAAMRSMPAL
jgi:Hemerythrin HHE cation binding domain